MNNFKVLSFALLGLLGLLGVIGEGLTIATDNFSSGVSSLSSVEDLYTPSSSTGNGFTTSSIAASSITASSITVSSIAVDHPDCAVDGSGHYHHNSSRTVYDGNTSLAPITVIYATTETSTIIPITRTYTDNALSTILSWSTTTKTVGGHTTTISYVEIVSYSTLSVWTSTFLAPPSPITFTETHTTVSVMTPRQSRPLDLAMLRRLTWNLYSNNSSSPSSVMGGLSSFNHTASTDLPWVTAVPSTLPQNATSIVAPFYTNVSHSESVSTTSPMATSTSTSTLLKNLTSTTTSTVTSTSYSGIVTISPASLSGLAIYTNTMGAGGNITYTSSIQTTQHVITTRTTMDVVTDTKNFTYTVPVKGTTTINGGGGGDGSGTIAPTKAPEHNIATFSNFNYIVAFVAALFIIFA